MGRRIDNSDRGVLSTVESWKRVERAISKIESAGRNIAPPPLRTMAGDDDGDPIRIGKTTSAWDKGTLATIAIYEAGTPPNETTSSETIEDCVNKFGDVASDRWVAVARAGNGSWYLIAAEC